MIDSGPVLYSDAGDTRIKEIPQTAPRALRMIGATDLRNVAIGYPRESWISGSQPLSEMCILKL